MDNDARALLEAIERNTDAVKKQTAALKEHNELLQDEAIRRQKSDEECKSLLDAQTRLLIAIAKMLAMGESDYIRLQLLGEINRCKSFLGYNNHGTDDPNQILARPFNR